MYRPMKSNTLRQGKPTYGFGETNSPNYKGATAVRPQEALQGTIATKLQPKPYDPKMLKRAIGRRLGK